MKKITFILTLEFEDKISDDNEIKEVAENVAEAIADTANHGFIAPENGDTYLKKVSVSSETLGINIDVNVF